MSSKPVVVTCKGSVRENYCSSDVLRALPEIRAVSFNDKVENDDVMTETNIQIKKFYFHKNVRNLSGWKIILSKDISAPFTFDFKLPCEVEDSILSSNDSKSSKDRLILHYAQIIEGGNLPHKDCYPLGMRISEDKKNREYMPINLNDVVFKLSKISKIKESLRIGICFDVAENTECTFAYAVFFSSLKTMEELLIETTNKARTTVDEFDSDLEKWLMEGDDLILDSTKIPLKSSLSFTRIKIPFRGKHCKHISPEDLETYVSINKVAESWLYRFYTKVLQNHPDVEKIELSPGAEYRIAGYEKKLSINNSKVIRAEIDINSDEIVLIGNVEIDDSFRENLSQVDNNGNQLPLNASSNINVTDYIELDGSFDDEPLTSVKKSDTKLSVGKSRQEDTSGSNGIVNFESLPSHPKSSKLSEIFASLGRTEISSPTSTNVSIPRFQRTSASQLRSIDVVKDNITRQCPVIMELVKGFIVNSDFYDMYVSLGIESLRHCRARI
uniref:SP-RING-type domain-containing protein n=1 Tax=Strongyloides venezuelensis TaxID=75913 RepID=A0A0K0F5K7_STRVS